MKQRRCQTRMVAENTLVVASHAGPGRFKGETMKKILLGALLSLGIVSSILITRAPAASAAPAFEDPQACLNGKLLMVEPTTAGIEAWLDVGPGVKVDLNVADCGGDPNQPAFAADHVLHTQVANWATLAVKTKKHTDVTVLWRGSTFTLNSGSDNWIVVTKRVN